MTVEPITADALRATFAPETPPTVGMEEELMLLDAVTLDLVARAYEVIASADGDARFKLELPASQLEVVSPPAATVGDAADALGAGRRDLAALAAPLGLRLAGAGAHPFAAAEGMLNEGARYDAIAAEYGGVARRQLVCGLHVHVAVRGEDRPLRVHDALRGYLPLLAALAANAPFHVRRDTGLASARPKISETLPRQGVPPALGSWEALAAALRWTGDPRQWWWELRLHPVFGTVELRVPDAQTTVAEAAAVGALAHALTVWLARRADADDLPAPADTWRIAENRWSACRHGLAGTMADLETGARRPTAELLAHLLTALAPIATELRCATELAHARVMLESGGPAAHAREVAQDAGLHGLVAWLVDRFAAAPSVPTC